MRPITIFFVPFVVAVLAYPILWYLSLGYFYKGEGWLDELYNAKKYFAKQEKMQKILVVSGSNSLFSIDSERMTQLTGISTYNFGGSAGLTLGFLADQVLQVVKSGDIVLMPLEYDYYSRIEPTDWVLDNLQGWGFNHLSYYLKSELWMYFKSPDYAGVFGRLNAGLRSYLFGKEKLKKFSIEDYDRISHLGPLKWQGYGLESMNSRGDFYTTVDPLPTYIESIKIGVGFPIDEIITDNFIDELARFTMELVERDVQLYLTWPVTAKNPLMDLSDKVTMAKVLLFRDRVFEKTGHYLLCDPLISNLPNNHFFDSASHPNAEGAELRTELLASCLVNELLKD